MALPVNMILVVYVILCILSYDFNKLTMLYIHVHISSSMTNKSGLTFFLSIKYLSVCLLYYVRCLQVSPCDIELMLTKVIFLMLNLDIWLVFSRILNGNFLFSKYFPKSIYSLMFVLDLTPGTEQTFLKKFSYPHI